MKRLAWIGFSAIAAAVLLASCHRPIEQAKAPPAPAVAAERAGPVRWNAAAGDFEMDGKPLKTAKLWTFDGSTDGWTALGSAITPAPDQGIAVVIADPTIRSPRGLNVPGSQYPLVLVRLTRTAAGSGWDGALYYSTPAHGETIGFLGKPESGADPAVGETTTLVYDMTRQAAGAPDWTQSAIDQIRFDIEDRAGGAFVIRQIAIAENPEAAASIPGAKPAPPLPAPKP